VKKLYIVLIIIGLSFVLLLTSLSSIVRWYVVKHSPELVGRQIEIKELHFNYFKTAVRIDDFVMHEACKPDTFLSFSELYVNYDPWALLTNEYAFSEIRLINPHISVIQNDSVFNFDDLLKSSDTTQVAQPQDTTREDFRFLIRNIKLSGGLIDYDDQKVKNHLTMRNLDIEIPQIAWDSRQSDVGISFQIGKKGVIGLGAKVNNQKRIFNVTVSTQNVDLGLFTNYAKSYVDVTSLKGYLTSALSLDGSMDDPTGVKLSGKVQVDSLLMMDGNATPILSAGCIKTSIRNIDMKNFRFEFNNIIAQNTRIEAILKRDGANLEAFFKPYFIADSIASQNIDTTIVTNELPLVYQIDTLRIEQSSLYFKDLTLNREFAYELGDINATMTNLTESSTSVPLQFALVLNKKGTLKGTMNFDMVDLYNFNTKCNVSKMDLVSFSPYSEHFIASPITQGVFNYNLSVTMNKTNLVNQNKVDIDFLKFGKRTHDSTAVKAPVRLALYILKDADERIAFDLPVQGNPSEPAFSLRKLIWKTLGNFFVKVAAEPFNAMAGLVSANPEDIKQLPLEVGVDTLSDANKERLHKIAEIMRQKPELRFTFVQTTNVKAEKEALAVQWAKALYVKTQNPAVDSLAQLKMANRLSLSNEDFNAFLAAQPASAGAPTTQEACHRLIGDERLQQLVLQRINHRSLSLSNCLSDVEMFHSQDFIVKIADGDVVSDASSDSMFKIEVGLGN